jgi:hypothetical protein
VGLEKNVDLVNTVEAVALLTVSELTRSVENFAAFVTRLERFTMLLLVVTPDSVEMNSVSLTVTT